jgi:hypothetical protein
MKAASFLIVACGFIAPSVFAQGQGLPPQAPPGQGGWTTEDARRTPNRPFENSYIVATVVKLSIRQKSGRFIVTLDNGQRWSQIQNKPDVSVSIGDEIKIQKSTLGSFMLTTAKGTETRVKRDR